MGNQKQRWTAAEEAALTAGVAKHGVGRWKIILADFEFATKLYARSNVDLKDKWRNMGVGNGQGRRDTTATTKAKSSVSIPLAPNIQNNSVTPKAKASASIPVAPIIQNNSPVFSSKEIANGHPPRSPQDMKNAPKYNAMIFEALSSLKDPNGCDIGAIAGFIEQKYEVPQNLRKLLSSKLRRLVLQGKLEKVQQFYKIKDTALGTKTPSPKQKDVRPKPLHQSSLTISVETVEEEAAKTAAWRIAEAENKAFLTAEAVKEFERISKMAEGADAMLAFAQELYVKCSAGEHILVN